jgi:hypothetical protein
MRIVQIRAEAARETRAALIWRTPGVPAGAQQRNNQGGDEGAHDPAKALIPNDEHLRRFLSIFGSSPTPVLPAPSQWCALMLALLAGFTVHE